MNIETCAVCGNVKPVANRTYNGEALCGECVEIMEGKNKRRIKL
jgi:predicted nucleic acid-binding Zn ribbon protein